VQVLHAGVVVGQELDHAVVVEACERHLESALFLLTNKEMLPYFATREHSSRGVRGTKEASFD
jgi:hypothetical protein